MNIFNNIGNKDEFVPVLKNNNRYIVSFDLKKMSGDSLDGTPSELYTWKSFIYNPAVNKKSIIDTIYDIINQNVAYLIENTFTWNNYSVHLDKENQMNYKAAFDLSVITEGESLPVTFRFHKGKNTELYTFETISELKDFYLKMNAHINKCLQFGWAKKDSLNESDYKI